MNRPFTKAIFKWPIRSSESVQSLYSSENYKSKPQWIPLSTSKIAKKLRRLVTPSVGEDVEQLELL